MDDLIADCITSGVKLAGHQYWLLYGTREVATVLVSQSIPSDNKTSGSFLRLVVLTTNFWLSNFKS